MTQSMVPLGEVIAERQLVFVRADGTSIPVTVKIGTPVPDRDGQSDYWCPFEIDGFKKPLTRALAGVDTMQALLVAVRTIPAMLEHVSRSEGGTFSFLGGPNLGFPEIPSHDGQ